MRPSTAVRFSASLTGLLLAATTALALAAPASSAGADPGAPGVYRNPLAAEVPGGGVVENCPDPSILEPGGDDPHWYVYCTTDPLNDQDRRSDGSYRFRLMPILRSADLVTWTYVGDVLAERPDWVAPDAGLWAPEVVRFGDRVHVYYTAQRTRAGEAAIGVATADSPAGPFTDSGTPVVEPQEGRWTYDPAVITHEGRHLIYYGSYFGGVWVRPLSPDGLTTEPGTETRITIANRYEAPYLVERDGWFYLFVSATDCCRGPLTGYTVFAGRSRDPLGPFLDSDGVSLLSGRVGGTPVIHQNGNRWVGAGHNAVFTDARGDDWFLYHAVDRFDPYFADAAGFTKRPLLLDRLDWVDGWPVVRAGAGPSDSPQQAPASEPGQPGQRPARSPGPGVRDDAPGPRIDGDDFADGLDGWTWVREPDPHTYEIDGGALRWHTQAADLHEGSNNASVLTRPAPSGSWVVETRLHLDLPPEGCCHNYVQAGLVVYGGDDDYVKLTHVAIWETRQTEFAKEWGDVPGGWPRYGNTVGGPPGEVTDLRIVKRPSSGGEARYTAYTRASGGAWVRGGTWTADLGPDARIGLVAMGGSGYVATFDHVSVHRLRGGSR